MFIAVPFAPVHEGVCLHLLPVVWNFTLFYCNCMFFTWHVFTSLSSVEALIVHLLLFSREDHICISSGPSGNTIQN